MCNLSGWNYLAEEVGGVPVVVVIKNKFLLLVITRMRLCVLLYVCTLCVPHFSQESTKKARKHLPPCPQIINFA